MSAEIHNADVYREMSEPFESLEAADAALAAFDKELRELRVKHKITDVLCVTHFNTLINGKEQEHFATSLVGSVLMGEGMAAYAFGSEKARARQRIARLLAEAAKGGEE
jgi:hypothetical protein